MNAGFEQPAYFGDIPRQRAIDRTIGIESDDFRDILSRHDTRCTHR